MRKGMRKRLKVNVMFLNCEMVVETYILRILKGEKHIFTHYCKILLSRSFLYKIIIVKKVLSICCHLVVITICIAD